MIAAFNDRHAAEAAVDKLHQSGFSKDDVSLIAKDDGNHGARKAGEGGLEPEKLTSGATWGAGAGGAAGLLASAGLIAIPGIGPILAIGPIAATLTGVASGGLAGAFVDWGLPGNESKKYEEDVKAGQAVVAVACTDDARTEKARRCLDEAGAHNIETH